MPKAKVSLKGLSADDQASARALASSLDRSTTGGQMSDYQKILIEKVLGTFSLIIIIFASNSQPFDELTCSKPKNTKGEIESRPN